MLVTEILEVLELRVKRIEDDQIKDTIVQSVTTTFDYTQKGKPKGCHVLMEVKNTAEKVLQSRETMTEYTVNNKGDIARIIEKQILDVTDPAVLSDTRIENRYGGKKLIKKSYIVGDKITGEDFYFYDSKDKLVLKQSMNDNGIGQIVFIYGDMNELVAVGVIESVKTSDGLIPSCKCYNIERNGNGYISEINLDGGNDLDSEFFTYYEDGSITVEKAESVDGVLTRKTKVFLENQ